MSYAFDDYEGFEMEYDQPSILDEYLPDNFQVFQTLSHFDEFNYTVALHRNSRIALYPT